MKKHLLAAVAASAVFIAPQAHAAVEICDTPNCAPARDNVLFDKTTSPVATVTGKVDGNVVLFTSPTGELLTAPANGQARVEASDGVLDGITLALENGFSFTTANFNVLSLQRQELASSLIDIVYQLTNGTTGSEQFSIGNGQNKFGIFGAPEGTAFLSLTINGVPEGFGFHDLRQVKLGGIAPVSVGPEPGTWMLMIVGIGAVGAALRRRKRGMNAALPA